MYIFGKVINCAIFNSTGNDIGAWTPLIWACYKGHPRVVETLIRHGADINSRGMHHVSGSVLIHYKCHKNTISHYLLYLE